MDKNRLRQLRKLNFQQLIHINNDHVASYSFSKYRKSGSCHSISGFCVDCENNKFHEAHDGSGFSLNNISHGTTSNDFFAALPKDERKRLSGFCDEPVMFVFDSPAGNKKDRSGSNQSGNELFLSFEYATDSQIFTKRPAQKWYWVNNLEECHTKSYPDNFRGGKYGELILSVLLTFKLGNAYVTNLVKCGMNDSTGDNYRPIKAFKSECIDNCTRQYLQQEIKIISPKVIFTFGTEVATRIKTLLERQQEPKPIIQRLPHPAREQYGFSDDYYAVLYYWLILRGLIKAEIVSKEDASKLAQMFLAHEFPA